jgi:UDP-3-O-[3-hydroxymyristoyl] glucosamine N-acyltransferase
MGMTLTELAGRCQAALRGDPALRIERVATLEAAGPHDLVFVASDQYLEQLAASRAGAAIVEERFAARCTGNLLISSNPRLCYTRAAALLHPAARPAAGRHPSAVVEAGAQVDPTAALAAQVVVGAGAVIGARTVVEAGTVIGRNARVGADCWLNPRVVVSSECVLGDRCVVQAGAVIGSDGFGFALDGVRWEKTPQLGRVVVGDDVEIGANTAIDRGALDDTVIERGVKLDNLIHIAHNVVIGEDTAIAACVGIAGSTRVGKRCTLAGQVGVVGHIEIADDVHVMGAAVVSHTIREPGTYAGSPIEPYQDWLRNAVRMRQLDDLARRFKKLEQRIARLSRGENIEES